ncbi:MAG: sugar phosphate isomerase/epimerase [Saprospiraceae bacterium]|nr:sugar phosphate isomerase/epimerase [Saprospiraceae bacterium]
MTFDTACATLCIVTACATLRVVPAGAMLRIVPKPAIGISENLEHDSLLAAAGYTCIIESIGRRISPRAVSDEVFQKNVATFKNLKTPVYAFNLFIPAELKLVGPDVDEKAVLEYVETVMRRLSQTDTRMIVWGSGGARRIPEAFDRKTAEHQFVAVAKKIARIAGKYGIVIALENLNSGETNFINTVKEALHIVKKVNHPNLRLNADIYHMLKEGEAPGIIAQTRKYLVHVEIAEKDNRTAPGVAGDDFRPYLRELKKVGYHNKIVIEGRWENLAAVAAPALQYLKIQIDEVYGK